MKEISNSKYQILLPLVLSVGLAIGIYIGINLTSIGRTEDDIKKIKEVLSIIKTEYVDEVETSTLVDDGIQYILSKLDPHSIYISEEEKKEANEGLYGSFDGIGIEFNIFMDTLVVITPLSDGPAAAVGLVAGDRIVGIDGENIAGIGLKNSDVIKRLKGPRNTKVIVRVLRKNVKESMVFTIVRNKIPQFSINTSYMIGPEIGYIKVSQFSQTTHSEFRAAMAKLKKAGMTKLVLDLQGNPGGYMNQAISLADEFLPAGRKIVYTKGKNKQYDSEAMATDQGSFDEGELIVLINEGSSSASEIVAGALQDNDRALIVGRQSYGKGLVQSPFNLSNGAELRLTVSRYYTPSGRSIQRPYSNSQKYLTGIVKRYKNGEFFYADSIHFNDSLMHTTVGGRTVYGGGGIMPDYFVPLDTAGNNPHINALFSSNSIQEYAFQFALESKAILEVMGLAAFRENFKITNTMVAELVKIGQRNKIKVTYENLYKNKNTFETLLKATIARRIWGNEGFYLIFNDTNKALQKAGQLLDTGQPITYYINPAGGRGVTTKN